MLSDDGSASTGPELLPTIVIATSEKALMDPVAPPIVAEAEVKEVDPKLDNVLSEHRKTLHSSGRSTTHSAELLAAPETVPEVVDV